MAALYSITSRFVGATDIEIKPPPPLTPHPPVGAQGYASLKPDAGQNIALHASPAVRTSTHIGYLVSAVLVLSISFLSPNFFKR